METDTEATQITQALGADLEPPTFSATGGEEGLQARVYLDQGRASIRQAYEAGASGRVVMRAQAQLVDRLLEAAFSACGLNSDADALVAIGGYGRATLAPFSDIDLLLLLPEEGPGADERHERLLYLLWDAGLELGHAVRRPSECQEIALTDATARTALLDCRHVAGDPQATVRLESLMLRELQPERVEEYLSDRLRDFDARRDRFGQTLYRLEPNIKEGVGGLRDLQTALWVARVRFGVTGLGALGREGLLPETDGALLANARDLLWRTRAGLHYRAGRRVERLTFDAQEDLAPVLGFSQGAHSLAVEAFMGALYLACSDVRRITEGILERCVSLSVSGVPRGKLEAGVAWAGGRLQVEGQGPLDAQRGLAVVRLAAEHQVPIAVATRERIRVATLGGNPGAWREPGAVASLLEIFEDFETLPRALPWLHRLGVLAAVFPEFGAVSGHWQHDLYHSFTVDLHSRFALERLARLLQPGYAHPQFTPMLVSLGARRVLALAVLLHDVGKGQGGGHSERGALMMEEIGTRLGLSSPERETLAWLVRAHLIMNRLSSRRDLSEAALIKSFAAEVASVDRLSMLTLLTYVDVSTTGEGTWTAWKESLLFELYHRTRSVLDPAGDQGSPRQVMLDGLCRAAKGRYSDEAARSFLAQAPPRYLAAISAQEAPNHLMLVNRCEVDRALQCRVGTLREDGSFSLSIATDDRPGLLADLSGALAAARLSVLQAELFSFQNKVALDLFQLREIKGGAPDWEALVRTLAKVAAHPGEGRSVATQALRRRGLRARHLPRVETKVRIDNDLSAETTVIDVFGLDRLGLLHAVSSALQDEGVQVVMARVATEGNRATDAFYGVDTHGFKIVDAAWCERLEVAVRAAVEPGSKETKPTT